ncbi:8665_t:CDS:2 [Scutellospora calospora]|uniref:8665_t:CDS:1 n=1 Tax=Scutellospora calospora TaxID=85575 RepID=A0ACA9JVI6_9GLOM|nr:8665_t:CDS:2 [Scutellospora calospora]
MNDSKQDKSHECQTTGEIDANQIGGIAQTVFVGVGTITEIFTPFVPYIEIILNAANSIIKIYEDAKYNKNICLVFVERMRVAKFSIERLITSKESNIKMFQEQSFLDALYVEKILECVEITAEHVQKIAIANEVLNNDSKKNVWNTFKAPYIESKEITDPRIGDREVFEYKPDVFSVPKIFTQIIADAWQGNPINRPNFQVMLETLDKLCKKYDSTHSGSSTHEISLEEDNYLESEDAALRNFSKAVEFVKKLNIDLLQNETIN